MRELKTPWSETLGLDWPLVLAPLSGGPSTPELVAAVCEAGGLGSLGAAYLSPGELEAAIAGIRARTRRPFAVNLFAPAPEPTVTADQIERAVRATRGYRAELGLADPPVSPPFAPSFAEQMAVVLRTRPAVFSFTFGLVDSAALAACRELGIHTIGTATTVDEGKRLEAIGVDAVVGQGVEAGGHRGLFTPEQRDSEEGTLALTRGLVRALRVPVIASGGIMDGAGIAAVLVLGAQAAQLGTAFLLCDEAGTSPAYRAALRAARGPQPRLTRAFSGRWARGIENRFLQEMAASPDVLPYPAQNAFTRDIRKRAAERGRAEFLSLWAGQGVGLIREGTAAGLVRALREEAVAALT